MTALAIKYSTSDSFARKSFKFHPTPIPKAKGVSKLSPGNIQIQRKPNCPCGGGCPECNNHLPIQTKLKVNEPGDKCEQEADRVADEMTRMPDDEVTGISHIGTNIQRKCTTCVSSGGLCPECEDEGEGLIQRNVGNADPSTMLRTGNKVNDTNVSNDFLQNLGPGQPLDPTTRTFFEPRFGHDFSNVCVHTDSNAAKSAETVNAHAYTLGHDVVFGEGQYAPWTNDGNQLLAHELTHVVQQAGEAAQKSEQPALIQRTIGDGHDLTSPRFAGDLVLEAVFDNERLLAVGSRGEAVAKVQQALVDAGFPLPEFGVDGIFGSETRRAVVAFQTATGLTVDGIVGLETIGHMDRLPTCPREGEDSGEETVLASMLAPRVGAAFCYADEPPEDVPPAGSCECDCQSYCGDLAKQYAEEHLPAFRWELPHYKIAKTECFIQREYPPCSWVCTANFEDDNKNLYPVIVQLMGSQRFNIGTVNPIYPLCSYDFKCVEEGGFARIKLSEVGCIDRTLL